MSEKMVTVACRAGEDIWNAVDRAKDDGRLPQTATVGAFDRATGKPEADVIGSVNVRPRESFWIRDRK